MTRLPSYVGVTYQELPEFVKLKKVVLKKKNNDTKCFLWSILAYFHPANNHVDRLSNNQKHENEFNLKGIARFPMDILDII